MTLSLAYTTTFRLIRHVYSLPRNLLAIIVQRDTLRPENYLTNPINLLSLNYGSIDFAACIGVYTFLYMV